MKLGLALPQYGVFADPAATLRVVDGLVDEVFVDFQLTTGSVDEYLDLARELRGQLHGA